MRAEIERAAEVLRRGGVVAFPTETVYGLGADAANAEAVVRLFTAKGRPEDKPITILLGRLRDPSQFAHWTAEAERLADAFWPGPLTLVLPRTARVSETVSGGLDTVGLRVPDHPIALDLLDLFGGGLATPSANRSGEPPPTTAAGVRAALGDRIDALLDGGTCRLGVASTVLSLVGTPTVLRAGSLSATAIADVLGRSVVHG